MNRKDLIIFLHIPKTAGSTLWDIIFRVYGPERACRIECRDYEKNGAALRELLCQGAGAYDLVGSHFFFGAHTALQGRTARLFTLLRAPAERAVSQYYQIVRRATNRHHAEFIRDRVGIEEGLRRVTDNVQVRYLATCRPGEPCTREHLERAKQRLETDFAVLGLQARFDESLVLLKRAFDWPLPVYCRRNVGANRPPRIAPAVLALARDLHRLDVELYAFAEALFAARLRRQPAGFHFDLWRLRSRNRLSRWLTPPEPSKEHD